MKMPLITVINFLFYILSSFHELIINKGRESMGLYFKF